VYNIPLILAGPGVPARGQDDDTLTSLVDVGPTLLDLCGLSPLPTAHGRSLRPVLKGAADPSTWRDAFAEFFGQRFVYTQRLVWHWPWKYVFSQPRRRPRLPRRARRDVQADVAKDPTDRG
jgi:arylsulfatase A-like enzyme